MQSDKFNLKLLGLLHIILGGVIALSSLFTVLLFLIFISIITGAYNERIEPDLYAWILLFITGLMSVTGWTLATIMLTAGDRLSKFSSYRFCYLLAHFECISYHWAPF